MSAAPEWLALLRLRRRECVATFDAVGEKLDEGIAEAAATMRRTIAGGGRICACGNGGSAAQAAHFVTELVGRFGHERAALPALCLNSNAATLTALANDFSFAEIFARQVQATMRDGDILLAISTSGASPNVIAAAQAARALKAKVIGLTGGGGGQLAAYCDLLLTAPSSATPRIQEVHLWVLHALAELLEI